MSKLAEVISVASARSLWSSQPSWSRTLSRLASSRRFRYPRLKLSPSRIIALRLRSKTDSKKKAYRHAFEFAANQRADRLPLLMLQAWMSRQDTRNEPRVSEAIRSITSYEWADRFHGLASRGWSIQDLDHWIWILSAENGDARIQRLVSTDSRKPIFLMMLLARCEERFRKAESILSLIDFASKHYLKSHTHPSADDLAHPDRAVTITVSQFHLLLRRLVHHVLQLWPRSIITVARFTADYIRRVSSDTDANTYRHKCEVFNTALLLFKRPAATQPIANMEFNWRAQKLLLAMSENLDKPLIINKASYRAIREVMVGLKKSKTEMVVAVRYSKTWPPYRQDFDGLDARRTAEDDYSRSVKAGILMGEAGYPEEPYDHALGALGGMGINSPTVQTRSLPPKEWKDKEQDRNLYSRWAMMIRATRNRQEAWKVFNNYAASTGKSPNIQIYAEMFIKLQARLVSPTSTALPGDSRESFPIHDANYSEYELARLSPPTVGELYDQMTSRGVKPEGHCLRTLVANASSVEEGTRYLRDSALDPGSVNSLGLFKKPSYKALRKIPLLVFRSYIQLLCRLQPDRRGRSRFDSDELFRIPHAIELARLRLRPDTTEASTFRPPWSIILRALARPHVCVSNGTETSNDADALSISMVVVRYVQERVGVDPEMFLYLCRAVQKAALSRLTSLEALRESGTGEISLVPSGDNVLRVLKTIFSKLAIPVGNAGTGSESLMAPQFMHDLGPAHLHTYMRTLAFLDDTTAMKELLQWMLVHQTHVNEEAERIENRGYALIAKTLCAFQAFAGPRLDRGEQAELISRMEDAAETADFWKCPTPEQVENYIHSDLRGSSQRLQQRMLARLWSASAQQESREAAGMEFV
ncbi:hypothetical protein GGR54DRAFT_406826 [Hypoxylon sp. NC1633]|nr:hypothetical protein GGR54DRAFT_406826 [Hypoxylon sp. NC1633]